MPIDSSSGTTLGFGDLGFSTAGLGYRIREPAYELSRWQGRVLRLTKPDGTILPDIFITHSDDNTLYFAAQAQAIVAGWKYQIVEVPTGTVWLRQSGQ